MQHSVCSMTPLKLHWFPRSLEKGGELQADPPPFTSPWSQQGVDVNQPRRPDVTACTSWHLGVTLPKETLCLSDLQLDVDLKGLIHDT